MGYNAQIAIWQGDVQINLSFKKLRKLWKAAKMERDKNCDGHVQFYSVPGKPTVSCRIKRKVVSTEQVLNEKF